MGLPPGCGIIAFASALKFEIVNDVFPFRKKQIIGLIRCPDGYGIEFFKKDNVYKAELAKENNDGFDYLVSPINYKERKLETFWDEEIEIIY